MMTLALVLALATPPQAGEARVVVKRMPAAGLGHSAGITRRDPSDILRVGELDYVFYTRVEASALHYPRRYTGQIWYATSADEGHTWTERGLALDRGPEESFDSLGVFDPNVVRDDNGSILLYYGAIGGRFNFRFESAARTNPFYIGVAEMLIDEGEGHVHAKRLTDAPVLTPSPKEPRSFDSLQVADPTILIRDGLFQLYYQGRPFPETDDHTATGLVVSELPTGPFVRPATNAPALHFSKETFVWPSRGGVLSLVTRAERGLYWAIDGIHFARVLERVEGSLNEPGLARPEGDEDRDKLWGLHVARYAPEPYLERFELELIGEITPPPATILPVPSAEDRAASAGWLGGGDWLGQHADIIEIAERRPKDVVFLGDSITQSWGGAGREVGATGAAAFSKHFGHVDTGNYGISGDRTQHILWRIDQGEFHRGRSKVVVLLIGTNNIGSDTPHEIAAGVHAILTRLRRVLPNSEVLLLGILPRGASLDDERGSSARATNELLASYGRLPRVNYLDLSGVLADEQGVPRADLYAGDRLHLSAAGYEALGSALHLPVAKLMLAPQLR